MANDKFTVLADIKSFYGAANFIHTNVVNLTGDPTVQTKDDSLATNAANGNIQLISAVFVRFFWRSQYIRDEIWHVVVDVHYSGNLTTLREIVGEMDRLNNANNLTASPTYTVRIIAMDDDDVKQFSRIQLILEYNKLWNSVPGT